MNDVKIRSGWVLYVMAIIRRHGWEVARRWKRGANKRKERGGAEGEHEKTECAAYGRKGDGRAAYECKRNGGAGRKGKAGGEKGQVW